MIEKHNTVEKKTLKFNVLCYHLYKDVSAN